MRGMVVLLVSLLVGSAALAGEIPSYAQLESILGDQLLQEDFEGFSLAGGTSIPAPNPLDSTTKPEWNLEPGVTYSSTYSLVVYAGQLLGDDSNILAGVGGNPNDVTIEFVAPQLAVGLYLVNITGNLDYQETVTFSRGSIEVGSLELTLPSASEHFVGWQDFLGITTIRVTSDSFALVDNVTWGVGVNGTPAALPAPDGRHETTPLRAERLNPSGDTVRVTWDVASCTSTDYNLIFGFLSAVSGYALNGADCSIGTDGSHDWPTPPVGDLYFLVVGTDGAGTESSWGVDGSNQERNGLIPSGTCGVIAKNVTGSCP